MKKHPPTVFPDELWKEIGLSLSKPKFSAITSVTVEKIRQAKIAKAEFIEDTLVITLA
ncbi:MAG: hypothetical protein O3A87_09630 [Verrucomicrobia bacterium]|nr:hypothetical protein [Verrucomicrobiota bacterium]MDA1006719.1 hypothetical protein [Verrucomicrobiota bacterium]